MLLADADPLTQVHQREQLKIARTAQARSTVLWQLMDFYRLDESERRWLPLMTRLVIAARRDSAALASLWYSAVRQGALGEPAAAAAVAQMDAATVRAAATSLQVVGPVRVKQAIANGLPQPVAMQRGLTGVLGSVQRQVLNGGRQATIDLIGREPRTVRYARVASGPKSCPFCLMLAGRGAVYTADSGDFKAHDACGCTIQPRFT